MSSAQPIDFIKMQPPFDHLTEAELALVAQNMETVEYPQGTRILKHQNSPSQFLYMIRDGVVRLVREGRVVQVLEEGELFGYPSLINQVSPSFDVIAEEDIMVYRIPEDTFHQLVDNARFAEFFLKNLGERLRQISQDEPSTIGGDLSTSIESVMNRSPLTISPLATVSEAAQAMSQAKVDAALVKDDPPGIITDSDFRVRVLAEEKGPETPVQAVMSRPLLTQPADTPVYGALLFMLEENIHHLAVTDEDEIVGLVTVRDLVRLQTKSPLYLHRQLENLDSPEALSQYAFEVAGMVETLFNSGLDVTKIGQIVASLNDTLIRRLLRFAEDELGPPPTPYAWIVFGSEGRFEQALLTDQDNALIYDENVPAAQSYFSTLADKAVDNLVRAGFPPCSGGYMAKNWCKPLDEWVQLFNSWIMTPDPEALLESGIFFDFRAVYGELSLEPLEQIIVKAGDQHIFLGQLAASTLQFRPPLSFFRRIQDEGGLVDLKVGGIAPIVALARVYALAAHSRARSTTDRLQAAAEAKTLSQEGAETLAETYHFLLRLRLRDQLRAVAAGEAPDNKIRLKSLSPVEHRHLKEAFLAIREMQEAISQRFSTGLLG